MLAIILAVASIMVSMVTFAAHIIYYWRGNPRSSVELVIAILLLFCAIAVVDRED